MKLVKIGALWCPACLIVNKSINKIKENYNIDIDEYDYDFDEDIVKDYNVGDTLPVLIFFNNNNEYKRLIGEVSYNEIENVVKEVMNSKSKKNN